MCYATVGYMSCSKCAGFALAVVVCGHGRVSPAIAQPGNKEHQRVEPIAATTKAQERWADRTLSRDSRSRRRSGQMIEVRGITWVTYNSGMIPEFKRPGCRYPASITLVQSHLSVKTDGAAAADRAV